MTNLTIILKSSNVIWRKSKAIWTRNKNLSYIFFDLEGLSHDKTRETALIDLRIPLGMISAIKQTIRNPFFIFTCLSLGIYAFGFHAGFQYDDYRILAQNPATQHPGNLLLLWRFDPTRFLPHLSFAVNYALNPSNLLLYHLVNVFLHISCAYTVFCLSGLLLSTPRMANVYRESFRSNIQLFCGLFFLVHPLQVQAVTYIVQRSTVMASLFYLLSLYFYIQMRLEQNKYAYAFSLGFAFLGALSKPIIATLPFMIILTEMIFFRRTQKNVAKVFFRILPFFLVIVFVAVFIMLWKIGTVSLTFLAQVTQETDQISRLTYFLTQFNVIILYIALVFVPAWQNFDYGFPLAHHLFEWPTLTSCAILLFILFLSFRLRRKYPLCVFGVFWFFITLIPESSVFPLSDVIFEHRLYLPLAGASLFIMPALFLALGNPVRFKRMAIFIIACLSLVSVHRNFIWADQERFLKDNIMKSPLKPRPVNNLADFYLRSGNLSKAEQAARAAIRLDPTASKPYYNLGVILERQGLLKQAKQMYQKAIDVDPLSARPEYYFNLGYLYYEEGSWTQAELYYRASIMADPLFADAYSNLGNLYARQKRYKDAVLLFDKALAINPYQLNAQNGLAGVFGMMGQYGKAIEKYQELIARNPNFILAYNNLGNIYVLQKDLRSAEAVFKKAIHTDAQDPEAYLNLANVYYGLNRLEEAQANIAKAIDLLKAQGQDERAKQLTEKYIK